MCIRAKNVDGDKDGLIKDIEKILSVWSDLRYLVPSVNR